MDETRSEKTSAEAPARAQLGIDKAGGDDERADDLAVVERWRPYDRSRIRHITGIRIHQLTLPESLLSAPKPKSPSIPEDDEKGYGYNYPLSPTGEHSRRLSTSSFPFAQSSSLRYEQKDINTHTRERSSSSSTARPYYDPPSPTISLHHTLPRTRVTRPRAPTLAGEALESGHAAGSALGRSETREHEIHLGYEGQDNDIQARRPMRCFITLKIPEKPCTATEDDGVYSERRRTQSDERDLRRSNGRGNGGGNGGRSDSGSIRRPSLFTRTSSSTSSIYAASLPSTPTKPNLIRPSISTSSSSSSLPGSGPNDDGPEPRRRTVSLNTARNIPNSPSKSSSIPFPPSTSNGTLSRTSSRLSGEEGGSKVILKSPPSIRGLSIKKSRPSLSVSHQLANGHLSPTQPTAPERNKQAAPESPIAPRQTKDDAGIKEKSSLKGKEKEKEPTVPFYISPIHHPSTYPRFQGLEEGDFASWLTDTEAAQDELELEIWVEIPSSLAQSSGSKWVKLNLDGQDEKDHGGSKGFIVKLSQLRRGPARGENGVEFTFSHNTKEVYHIPQSGEKRDEDDRRNIVERSLRETRMKRGAGFGSLHQLVNLQAVVADTRRSIEQVRRKVDLLLYRDVDRSALRREVEERQSKVAWISEKIKEVERTTKESQAKITLRQQEIETRRYNLREAEVADGLRHGRAKDLDDEIERTENERISLLPTIHSLRAHHAQMLDALFPIQPLDPSQLLYTILNVPLPIPVGPKDPAPPLSMPEFKVDERSTAAALGYVALLVQILGNLGGATGGLPYVITCAGSRSAVRDGTGVMQGPRSFPLYAKGVERYRYEYAVFLLNKNIELLMQETNIRLLDLRHTLPNLKNLLLTLSSSRVPSSSTSTLTSLAFKSKSKDPFYGHSGHLGHGHRAGHGASLSNQNESGTSTPTLLNPFSTFGSPSGLSGGVDIASRASSAAWPHLAQAQAQALTGERARSPSAASSASPAASVTGDSPLKATTTGGQPSISSPLKPRLRGEISTASPKDSTPRHVHMRRSLYRAQTEDHGDTDAGVGKLGSSVDLTSDGDEDDDDGGSES
ncbi:hypothetical protein IAT40_007225 [Kwoniella sp. CBS 6097]